MISNDRQRLWAAAALMGWLLVLAPHAAQAKRFRVILEPSLGLTIPLNTYVNYKGGKEEWVKFKDGSQQWQDNRAEKRIGNQAHLAAAVTFLLDFFEFRYAANMMALGSMRHRIPDKYLKPYDTAAQRLAKPRMAEIDARTDLSSSQKEALKAALLSQITDYVNLVGLKKPEKLTETDVNDALTFHTLGFGYRFYLRKEGKVMPYIPVSLGPVIAASSALSRSLFGIHFNTGVGVDFAIHQRVQLGLEMRYLFLLTETDQELAAVKYAGTKDTMESSIAMSHLLSFTAHLTVPFGGPAPTQKEPLDVRLEVSPGVGFPIGRFLDGIPRYFNLDYGGTPWDFLEVQPVTLKTDVNQATAGFHFAISLLLNNFELRYQLQVLGWGSARITDVAYHNVSKRIFMDADGLHRLPVDVLPTVRPRFGPLFVHALGFGYRFALMEGRFVPYIPLLIGFAWVANDRFDPIYGGIVQTGLGFDVRLSRRLTVGLEARYSWVATQTPGKELYETSEKEQIGAAASSNDSGFETAMESLHLVTLQAKGQVCF